MNNLWTRSILIAITALALACGSETGTASDASGAGGTDAGSTDAGSTDAGSTDAGSVDGGTDSGGADAGDKDGGGATKDGSGMTGDTMDDGEMTGDTMDDGEMTGDTMDDGEMTGDTMDGGGMTGDTMDDGEMTGDTMDDGGMTGDTMDDGEMTGDTMDGGTAPATTPATALKKGELIITEIMPNPSAVGDSAGEWFEIKNTTLMDVDLNGLIIIGKNGTSHTVKSAKAILLKSGEYGVLGANADMKANGGVALLYAYGKGLFLPNNSGTIALQADKTTKIDEVNYQSQKLGWPSVRSGHALQLASAPTNTEVNDFGVNWCVAQAAYGAGDFGTPGKANPACESDKDRDGVVDLSDNCTLVVNPSQFDEDKDGIGNSCDNCTKISNTDQKDSNGDGVGDACPPPKCGNSIVEAGEECDDGNTQPGDGCSAKCMKEAPKGFKAGDIIITELMIDPKKVKDSKGEFIELYNTTGADLDLVGLTMKTKTKIHKIVSKTPLMIKSKGYLVLVISATESLNGGIAGGYQYKELQLSNSGSTVGIYAGTLKINSVTYPANKKSGWPDFKAGGSIQLSADQLDGAKNGLSKNWCTSTKMIKMGGDKGTPGAANDVCQ